MAEETTEAPAAEEAEQKKEQIAARLRGDEPKAEPKIELKPGSSGESLAATYPNQKKPESTPELDSEVEKIVAQADKPDAVRNAIKRHQAAATAERERAEAAEAKVKDYEDASKSEQEKLAEVAEDNRSRAEAAEAKLLRFQVAATKNLPVELADRLQGNDKRELEADADRLLELVKPSQPSGDADAGKGVAEKKDEDFNDILRRRRDAA